MSGKHIQAIPAILVLGSLFISLSAGCGTRVGPNGDPNETPPPATKPTPTPAASPSVAPIPVPSVPVVPTPAPQLQVSEKEFKAVGFTGLWGLLDKPYVDVMVTNPSTVMLTGTVKVSFTKKDGTPTNDDQSREVSLGGGQTQTLHFEATKGNPAAAKLDVTTNAPVAAPAGAAAVARYPAYPGSTLQYGR